MSYLSFNKKELVNLEYSLQREVLATNRAGGYASTTIVCCNTRKYHGLLVVPLKEFNNQNHVLLSSLDETIIQHEKEFNLGIHKYPGTYEPRGHKYIVDLEYDSSLAITYRVGGVRLKKELLLSHNESQIMIRYTLLDAHSETTLRLKPFLAFRNIHNLSVSNLVANTRYEPIENGIKSKMYIDFPYLHMQINKKNEFIASPDWYRNIQYLEEKKRGYEYQEDLFVPGYFEFPIKKGESIVFSASTEEIKTRGLKRKFTQLLDKRKIRNNFENSLKYSANQFIIKQKEDAEIVAGYPWSGSWGRDTFIALPGLMLYGNKDVKNAESILKSMCKRLKNGLFPNTGKGSQTIYNAADAPLWFFWTLQQLEKNIGKKASIWKDYGEHLKEILNAYKNGLSEGIHMADNGLIWAKQKGKALTWMDAVIKGNPVTQRGGFTVEINALWYNAVCYALELAKNQKDNAFVEEWKDLPERIKNSFNQYFWYHVGNYLADYVDEEEQNTDVRPNQIFACSLPYSPLENDQKKKVLDVVTQELLTPKGLRSLSPKNKKYKGHHNGNPEERSTSLHQGTVWPWLIGAYIEANFNLYKHHFTIDAKDQIKNYENEIDKHGICSISEIYDGDPPHHPKGSISQAWSVAEILRSIQLIKEFKNKPKK